MILVSVFAGGETRSGNTGVEYSIGPQFSFRANRLRKLDDIKCMIYQRLGCSMSEFKINIYARCNVGTITSRYYELAQIVCDESWSTIYDQTMSAKTQMKLLDLYIELVPIACEMPLQSCVQSVVPDPQPESRQTRYCDTQAGPSQTQTRQKEHTPPQNFYPDPYPDMNEFYSTPDMSGFEDHCPDDDDAPQSDDEDDSDYCDDDDALSRYERVL